MCAFTPGDGAPVVSSGAQFLQRLVGDWQIVADLAFCDLVLWSITEKDDIDDPGLGWAAIAQARPFTAQTALHQDLIGQSPEPRLDRIIRLVAKSSASRDQHVAEQNTIAPGVSAWPIHLSGQLVAVLTVHQNLYSQRRTSRLEEVYRDSARILLGMISRGQWPDLDSQNIASDHGTPRVGDGLIRISSEGLVDFASPNAVSAYRKLGVQEPLDGRQLARLTMDFLDPRHQADTDLPTVLFGRSNARADIATRNVVLSARAVPLVGEDASKTLGALVLLRDVSEIRWRDEQLISKDATIREIHHRVKNNLQTVGSLLRMQSRRMSSDEARQELVHAMSRVDTIAAVHETLSQTIDTTIDMDQLLKHQFSLAIDIASERRPIRSEYVGEFGQLPGDYATPLALVVNELVTNAVQHGATGEGSTVRLKARRGQSRQNQNLTILRLEVWNDAEEEFTMSDQPATGLGTQIVKTLVESDLRGSIRWLAASSIDPDSFGTVARVEFPIDSRQ